MLPGVWRKMEPLTHSLLGRSRWLGLLVGLLWLVHGLEKMLWMIAPSYMLPRPLYGGVGNVVNILTIFARDNPQPWFRAFVGTAMLPLGAANQFGVLLLELALALVFLLGPRLWARLPWLLYAAALVGSAQLAFIWMGFYAEEWPFTYLLIIVAQLVVALNVRAALGGPAAADDRDWGFLLRWLLGLVWLVDGARSGNWLMLIAGVGLLLGVLTPLFALIGLMLTGVAMFHGSWGPAWWWVYYFGIADHLYVLLTHAGRRLGVDRRLGRSRAFGAWPESLRP